MFKQTFHKCKALSALVLAATLAASAAATLASGSYGAIAFSPSNQGNGYAFGLSSAEAARQTAVNECEKYSGSGDCMSVVTIQEGCGALAASSDAYGTGVAADLNAARAAAMQNCQAYSNTKDCNILRWLCR